MDLDLVLPVTYAELMALLSSVSTINCVYGGTDILNELEKRLRKMCGTASGQTAAFLDVQA